MNILFVNPANKPFTSKAILIEPIDLLQLATFIKSFSHEVEILDMDVLKMSSSDFSVFLQNKKFDLVVIVFDYHIPLHDSGTNEEVSHILNILKNYNIKSVLGGKFATFSLEHQLENVCADYYIKYDIEKPLLSLIDFLQNNISINEIPNLRYWNNDKLVDNNNLIKIDNDYFSQLPIPDRNLIDLNNYIDVRTVLSSRGCNLKCSFCHVPGFWGKWKYKNSDDVVDEIMYLQKNYNSKKILFLDDNATAQPLRMNDISKKLINNESKASLGCLSTIVSFHEDTFNNMFKANFKWVHFGIESANNQSLQLIGKKTNIEQIKTVIQKTLDIGFRVRTSWILDLPNYDENNILDNEKFITEQNSQEIRLHFLTLRLGSEFFNKYHINTKQYIHNSKQNLNLSKVSSDFIYASLQRIIDKLLAKGYVLVTNPDDFFQLEILKSKSPDMKIVSLCPLRYGIEW